MPPASVATMTAMPDTLTIPDVELVSAGRWNASTGQTEITDDDLAAMLAASQDFEVDGAAMRIGHVDPRFDGDPALGWVRNLRIVGSKLIGDLVDVPAKLAEVLPKAFRRRSVEISWNVKTPSGRTYKAALSGLALLGVTPPAVKGLADVLALYAADPTDENRTMLVDRVVDGVVASELSERINDCRGTVAIGVENDSHAVKPVHAGRELSVNDEQIRALFGLAADAPITDQMRSIAEERQGAGGEPTTPPAEGQPTPPPAAGGEPTTPPAAGAGEGQPTSEGQPTGTPELVTVAAGQFAELQRQAAQGAEAMRIIGEQERERVLQSALSEGRIAPADVERWRTAYTANPDGTRTLLSSLTPVVPVTAIGSDAAVGAPVDDNAWAQFEADTFGIAVPKGA